MILILINKGQTSSGKMLKLYSSMLEQIHLLEWALHRGECIIYAGIIYCYSTWVNEIFNSSIGEVSHAFFLIKGNNPTVTNKTVITALRLQHPVKWLVGGDKERPNIYSSASHTIKIRNPLKKNQSFQKYSILHKLWF